MLRIFSNVQNLFRIFSNVQNFKECSEFSVMFRLCSEYLTQKLVCSESLDFVVYHRVKHKDSIHLSSTDFYPYVCIAFFKHTFF